MVDVSEDFESAIDLAKLNKRREARRRRILGQAKNRLQQLNERNFNSTEMSVGDSIDMQYPDPEVQPDSPQIHSNMIGSNQMTSDTTDDLQTNHRYKPYFLQTRGHIFIVSLISYIFTILWYDGKCPFGLYLPVLLCVILEKVFFSKQEMRLELDPYTLTLCTISGLNVNKFSTMWLFTLRGLSIFVGLISEFAVTLFFYTVITLFLTCFTNKFVDLAETY